MGYDRFKRDRPSQLTQAISTLYPRPGNNFHQQPPLSREHKGRGDAEQLDCFAEPVIGRRFAPTRWLAMTLKRPRYSHGLAQENVAATLPSPANSITTLSPALSQIVLTRLPVSTISPARKPLPSEAR